MVLAEPIVALIFERRAFMVRDTVATAAALMFYAPGLIGYSAVKIASPTFYALRDSRTPVIVSLLSIGVNLGINLILIRLLGYRGLALGTAVAALFNAAVLMWLLRERLGGIEGRRMTIAFMKITVASLAMALAAHVTVLWLTAMTPGAGDGAKFVRVFGAIAAALVVLVGAARLLRIDELSDATARVAQRFGRR
jgi:putative peptidoglycan lipid II flippase